MNYRDAEMSDIVIVMDKGGAAQVDDLVARVTQAGVVVSDADPDNGVIEGTIESTLVKSIEKLEGVKYVRSVFTYVADFPVGDPRNQDEDDRADEAIPQ
jgi:hypothetical protein